MDNKSCKVCGVVIQPATEVKYDGCCVPCSKKKDKIKFKPSVKLTRWVKYFLYAQIVIGVISIISGYFEYKLLNQLHLGLFATSQHAVSAATENDNRQLIIGGIGALIHLVSGILILRWIYQANINSAALGAKNMKFTPGWAIGWFFVPIAAMWKPYQAMSEIWRSSCSPEKWESLKVSNIVNWWWFTWITVGIISQVSSLIKFDSQNFDELINASLLRNSTTVYLIPLAIITFLLISRIHKFQNEKANK